MSIRASTPSGVRTRSRRAAAGLTSRLASSASAASRRWRSNSSAAWSIRCASAADSCRAARSERTVISAILPTKWAPSTVDGPSSARSAANRPSTRSRSSVGRAIPLARQAVPDGVAARPGLPLLGPRPGGFLGIGAVGGEPGDAGQRLERGHGGDSSGGPSDRRAPRDRGRPGSAPPEITSLFRRPSNTLFPAAAPFRAAGLSLRQGCSPASLCNPGSNQETADQSRSSDPDAPGRGDAGPGPARGPGPYRFNRGRGHPAPVSRPARRRRRSRSVGGRAPKPAAGWRCTCRSTSSAVRRGRRTARRPGRRGKARSGTSRGETRPRTRKPPKST